MAETTQESTGRPRRRRADGERSRHAILDAAARLATVDGLDGLSIGGLAEATGMSKSGLYAHFGSKEELQLATIEHANGIFADEVLAPALAAPEGKRRAVALCDAFFSYVERGVFPGGCFFASTATEFGARSGALRERIAAIYAGWIAFLEQLVREAQALGELSPGLDAAQLAFELDAIMLGANDGFLLLEDAALLDRGRTAVRHRLG